MTRLPPDDPRAGAALEVIHALHAAGHQALLAGGCVRDLLMGRRPKDYDVASDARPEQVRRLFRRTVEVGAAFGVMRVLVGPHEIEVATFRVDVGIHDGRRPAAVEFTDARRDAERRDFTINGMFLEPESGQVLDFVGGRDDLAAGAIRAIRNPEDRFAEDRLRMLRAVRFATVLGFAVEPGTWAAVRRHADGIHDVSGERIREELAKTLGHPDRARGVRLLWESGLAGHVLPEAATAWEGRGDAAGVLASAAAALPADTAWDAVLSVLLAGPGPAGGGDRPALSAAAAARAEACAEVPERLALTRTERQRLDFLLRRRWELDFADQLDLAGRKRLFAQPHFPDLAAVQPATERLAPTGRPDAAAALALWRSLPPEQIKPVPLVNGRDLQALGVRPGPALGRILEAVYDAQLRGDVADRDAALAEARRLTGLDG